MSFHVIQTLVFVLPCTLALYYLWRTAARISQYVSAVQLAGCRSHSFCGPCAAWVLRHFLSSCLLPSRHPKSPISVTSNGCSSANFYRHHCLWGTSVAIFFLSNEAEFLASTRLDLEGYLRNQVCGWQKGENLRHDLRAENIGNKLNITSPPRDGLCGHTTKKLPSVHTLKL